MLTRFAGSNGWRTSAIPSPSSVLLVARQTTLNLERSGLIQIFEFSFELAWKTLKDLLFYEGYEPKTPRAAIREGFESEYLDEDDCETLLDALDKRNLLSLTYRKALALEAETLIKTYYHPVLTRLHATLQAQRPA